MNLAVITGNLGRDPELRYAPSGSAVASISVATNERWTNKDGEKQEHTEWHRVVCWEKLAENVAEYLHKGSKVLVKGRLRTRSWEDSNGVQRYVTEIIANNVEFLDRNGGSKAPPPGEEDGGYVPSDVPDDDIPF